LTETTEVKKRSGHTVKGEVIAEIKSAVARSQTMVIAEYRGTKVGEITQLRMKARNSGVSLHVFKNSLARRAVSGSPFDVVSSQMTGPLMYAFSSDAVAAAKVVTDFAKSNDKFVIKAGAFAGKALDKAAVTALASIPPREVLLAQIAGLLSTPITGFARVLAALSEQKGGGAAPAEASSDAALAPAAA
jgi:large subunit ribosomal protein L10